MLYMLGRDSQLKFSEALLQYNSNIRQSYELYLFNLLMLLRIAEFAERDAARRKSKLLPTEEDRAFVPKLATNEVIQSLFKNQALMAVFKRHKLEEKIDSDSLRKIYIEFLKEDEYKTYLSNSATTLDDHQNILLALYKFCLSNELFEEFMEDNYRNWIDDKSLIIGAIKKTIKALPSPVENFYEEYKPDDETVKEFGESLMRNVYQNDGELLHLIEPVLKNWDAERVAIIDMILLKMALCELIDFPTIPTKVTLNEFVEISKLYSTDKSKDFINGILDRLMKQLNDQGKIHKTGRGLQE